MDDESTPTLNIDRSKIGTKKLRKLEEKEQKRIQREMEAREREEEKQRKEEIDELRRKKEAEEGKKKLLGHPSTDFSFIFSPLGARRGHICSMGTD